MLRRLSLTFFVLFLFLVNPRARSEDSPSSNVVRKEEEAPKPRFAVRIVLSDLEPTRDRETRKPEFFYGSFTGDYKQGRFAAHAEVRGREGRFREFYPGSVWLEEAYVGLETPAGTLRVGKLAREFGLADETFSGNLFSRNGVTRNPDWGASLAGSRRLGYDLLEWNLSYFGRNDHVSWEENGRGVESDPTAELRDGVELRAAYTLDKGLWKLSSVASFASSGLVTPGSSGTRLASDARMPFLLAEQLRVDFRRTDAAVDLTASLGPFALGVLGFHRDGADSASTSTDRLSYGDAWAGLFLFRAEFPTVTFRYTYSEWRYCAAGSNERLHQPAVVWHPIKNIEATIEYNARRLRGPLGARATNAFRFGLAVSF